MEPETDEIVPPGTVLGRYRVVRRLGSGGMGAVYEAIHTGLNKHVAMKVLHPAMAREAVVRARFLQEGEVAARIHHPHVVDVHDVATDGGVTYLVMDYLEGEDLAALVKREAPLSPPRIAELILPVTAAIQAAHDVGVVHRDLKPANVFLARLHGEVVPQVLDFGISKILQDQSAEALTRTGMVMGTPNYMSPEQVMGAKDLDGRADVYALGAILYECATGVRAFDGGSMVEILVRIAQGRYSKPREVRPEISEPFERLILKAMHPDRDLRFKSARELQSALLAFAEPIVAAKWFGSPAREVSMQSLAASAPGAAVAAAAGPATTSEARPLTSTLERPSSSSRGPIFGVAAAIVGAAIAAVVVVSSRAPLVEQTTEPGAKEEAPVATFAISVTVEPSSATVSLDGKPIGTGGRLTVDVPKDGREHKLTVTAEGYAPQEHAFFEDVKPPSKITLQALGKNDAPILR